MDLTSFDLSRIGAHAMPKSLMCVQCKKIYNYSPFSVITYANKKRVVENLCDECIAKLSAEGNVKRKELKRNIKNKEKDAIRQAKRRAVEDQAKKE